MTVTTKPVRIRWIAGADRVAHAHGVGRRALCGEPGIEERFAWPPMRRCMGCTAIVAEQQAAR